MTIIDLCVMSQTILIHVVIWVKGTSWAKLTWLWCVKPYWHMLSFGERVHHDHNWPVCDESNHIDTCYHLGEGYIMSKIDCVMSRTILMYSYGYVEKTLFRAILWNVQGIATKSVIKLELPEFCEVFEHMILFFWEKRGINFKFWIGHFSPVLAIFWIHEWELTIFS